MTSVTAVGQGIEVVFADGRAGLIPFTAIPEIARLAALASIELPNPYEIVLHDIRGETFELPWDFARHYCDASYRARIEAMGAAGDSGGRTNDRSTPSVEDR